MPESGYVVVRHRRRPVLLTAILLLVGGTSGCALRSKPVQPAVMATTSVTVSVEGLRSAVLERSQGAADALERSADTIAALSPSPLVRRHAIEWKLVSATDLQSAALDRDPVVALGDMILFAMQMQAFLTTGEGATLFGPQQGIAVAAVDTILADMMELVARITSPGAPARWTAYLAPLAAAHPIQAPYVGRAGVSDSVMGQLSTDRSALAAVGDIEVTARLLDLRIEQIQRSLLKQARWQAQLMLAEAAEQPAVDTLLGDMRRLTSSVERVTVVTEGLPDLVTGERIELLKAITAERQALLAALAEERALVLEALHAERVGTLSDAETSAEHLIDYALEHRLTIVIDHILHLGEGHPQMPPRALLDGGDLINVDCGSHQLILFDRLAMPGTRIVILADEAVFLIDIPGAGRVMIQRVIQRVQQITAFLGGQPFHCNGTM